jgi:hypothetical protein
MDEYNPISVCQNHYQKSSLIKKFEFGNSRSVLQFFGYIIDFQCAFFIIAAISFEYLPPLDGG